MDFKRIDNGLPEKETFSELLEFVSGKYGDRTAFSFIRNGVTDISYSRFRDDVSRLCGFLSENGLDGKTIALIGGNSYEYAVSYFAVLCTDGVIVPVCKDLRADEINVILSDCNPHAMIYLSQVRESMETIQSTTENMTFFNEETITSVINNGKISVIPENTDGNKVCCIVYTSGTSGIPKGVMLTSAGIIGNALSYSKNIDMDGKVVLCLPMHHMFAITTSLLMPLYLGLDIVINHNLKTLTNDLETFSPENICLVPAIAEFFYKKINFLIRRDSESEKYLDMINNGETQSLTFEERRRIFSKFTKETGGNLRRIISGAAALDRNIIVFLESIGIETLCGYGMTECSPVISVNMHGFNKYGSIGIPLLCNEVKTSSPDGVSDGEIMVRGSNVMKGYYNKEKETAEVFDGEWLKTGDRGHIDSDGYLFITGRIKNLIIRSSGENVSPEELELLVGALPLVNEVVVHEKSGLIVASVYPEEYSDNAFEQINSAVKTINSSLPMFKRIDRVEYVECSFPKTSTNKIKRNF